MPGQRSDFALALPWVAFVTVLFTVNYTSRALLGPMLVYIEELLHIRHAQAGALSLFLSTGFATSIFLSGFILAYVRPRHLAAISCLGNGLVLAALTTISSLNQTRALIFALGLVSGMYFGAGMATLGSLVRRQDWSKAVALHELAPPLGFIFAPLLAATAAVFGWRFPFTVMSALSFTVGILFLCFGKGGMEKADHPSFSGISQSAGKPAFWIFTWLFALGIAAEFAPFNVLTLALTTEMHMDLGDANTLLSASRLLAPAAALAGGWLTPWLGTRKSLALFLLAEAASLMALGFGQGPLLYVGMLFQPLAPAFGFPAIFMLLAEAYSASRQPLVLALGIPAASCLGMGGMPAVLGYLGETASFSLGFTAMGVLYLLTLPLVLATGEKTQSTCS